MHHPKLPKAPGDNVNDTISPTANVTGVSFFVAGGIFAITGDVHPWTKGSKRGFADARMKSLTPKRSSFVPFVPFVPSDVAADASRRTYVFPADSYGARDITTLSSRIRTADPSARIT